MESITPSSSPRTEDRRTSRWGIFKQLDLVMSKCQLPTPSPTQTGRRRSGRSAVSRPPPPRSAPKGSSRPSWRGTATRRVATATRRVRSMSTSKSMTVSKENRVGQVGGSTSVGEDHGRPFPEQVESNPQGAACETTRIDCRSRSLELTLSCLYMILCISKEGSVHTCSAHHVTNER